LWEEAVYNVPRSWAVERRGGQERSDLRVFGYGSFLATIMILASARRFLVFYLCYGFLWCSMARGGFVLPGEGVVCQ
jgi:hypothetical protein